MPTRYLTIGPVPYFGTFAQRSAILRRLQAGPATVEDLRIDCHIPSPTKRLSELMRFGLVVVVGRVHRINPDGTANTFNLYALAAANTRQPDLFPHTNEHPHP